MKIPYLFVYINSISGAKCPFVFKSDGNEQKDYFWKLYLRRYQNLNFREKNEDEKYQ